MILELYLLYILILETLTIISIFYKVCKKKQQPTTTTTKYVKNQPPPPTTTKKKGSGLLPSYQENVGTIFKA